jgi:hypothetical protein
MPKECEEQADGSLPSWSDPVVLAAIERAFDATWPVIRAHEAHSDKARMAELSLALSHRLVELATEGVTDPQELRRLALETFPLTIPSEARG